MVPDEVDVRLTKGVIQERRSQLRTDERVELRPGTSDLTRVRVGSQPDLDHGYVLIREAVAASLPTATPGVPPSGPELARRRRFH